MGAEKEEDPGASEQGDYSTRGSESSIAGSHHDAPTSGEATSTSHNSLDHLNQGTTPRESREQYTVAQAAGSSISRGGHTAEGAQLGDRPEDHPSPCPESRYPLPWVRDLEGKAISLQSQDRDQPIPSRHRPLRPPESSDCLLGQERVHPGDRGSIHQVPVGIPTEHQGRGSSSNQDVASFGQQPVPDAIEGV